MTIVGSLGIALTPDEFLLDVQIRWEAPGVPCEHEQPWKGSHKVLRSVQPMLCPTLQNPHMIGRLETQAALIQRGWDRSEWDLQARCVRCHPGDLPWSPGMGPGWADDIQCWSSSLGKQGIALCAWGSRTHSSPCSTAAESEKLAIHTHWPQVTLATTNYTYSTQRWNCYHVCAHRGE